MFLQFTLMIWTKSSLLTLIIGWKTNAYHIGKNFICCKHWPLKSRLLLLETLSIFVLLTVYHPGIPATSFTALFHSIWLSFHLHLFKHLTLRSLKHNHMNPSNSIFSYLVKLSTIMSSYYILTSNAGVIQFLYILTSILCYFYFLIYPFWYVCNDIPLCF